MKVIGWTITAFYLAFANPARAADPSLKVDNSTLYGKMVSGYQGWFGCPGDKDGLGWSHWMVGNMPTVEMLPDVSELAPDELCDSVWKTVDGKPIKLFSSQNPRTVDRHFAWMEQYGLDGVALQRFATGLRSPVMKANMDRVLSNVRGGAEAHGRVFFVMYDLSGFADADLDLVVKDWEKLEQEGTTDSAAYLHHRGHPLLGVWGLGFAGRPVTPDGASKLLDRLLRESEPYGGLTLMGGVPTYWRTGINDGSADPGWQSVYAKLAVISPWTVGRYVDVRSADDYGKTVLRSDLAAAKSMGADLLPVIFPGFSWSNMMEARHNQTQTMVFDQISRHCGAFYLHQVDNVVSAGATMLYTAMFDEVDEGTAMFKIVADAPYSFGDPRFLTLDEGDCRLPSDWYLRLAGVATATISRRATNIEHSP